MAQVITVTEYVDALKYMALHRYTEYNNQFPYNLGYYHSSGALTADCWNTGKAVIWSRGKVKDNYTPGNYYYLDALRNHSSGIIEQYESSGLGDFDGWNMLMHCSDVSCNFSKISVGEMLLTPDKSHFGTYVGDFYDESGLVNVIETTGAFGGGCTTSYVDSQGVRWSHKGGYQSYCWGWHGRMTEWIDYSDSPTPSKKIDVDGEFGPETVKLAQYALSLDHAYIKDIDGEISGQIESLIKQWVPAYVEGAWEFSGIGSPTVRAIQEVCAGRCYYTDTIDGIWGKNTSIGLQKFLNEKGANLDVDGEFGPLSTKAYQTFLNKFVD